MPRLLVWTFLLCLIFPSEVLSANANQLVYRIRTDKEQYILGESVTVTYSWQNITSKNFSIETWLMEPIEVSYENQTTRIPYKGIISDGTPGYRLLSSKQSVEESYVINNFFDPNYAIDKPGQYHLKSTYVSSYYSKRKNFWLGVIDAPAIHFNVRALAEEELAEYRAKIASGNAQAVQIIAGHRDKASIQLLVGLTKNSEIEIRRMAYKALAQIGTDESIRSLAEAAVGEPVPMEKVRILFILRELRNPVVIPYVKNLLKDEYVGGWVTTQGTGGKSVRYKVYMVRKWAYIVLKELGVDIPTIYEEEIK